MNMRPSTLLGGCESDHRIERKRSERTFVNTPPLAARARRSARGRPTDPDPGRDISHLRLLEEQPPRAARRASGSAAVHARGARRRAVRESDRAVRWTRLRSGRAVTRMPKGNRLGAVDSES